MTLFAWIVAGIVLVVAVLAAVATRVSSLEGPVRRAVMSAEALLVLVTVVDVGLVLRAVPDERPDSMVTHVGYAVAAVGIVPLLVFRRPTMEAADVDADAATEQGSLWVVVVALVAAAICVVRLAQTR